VADSDGVGREVDIRPIRVHHFLFPHSSHQEELIPEPLFLGTGLEELVEFVLFIHLRLFFGVPRPIVLADETANSIGFQEPHDGLELVVDRSRRLLLLIPKKSREFEQVIPLDLVEIELAAGFSEVVEGGRIRSQGFGLLREFGFF
jgi:hypothetical protein